MALVNIPEEHRTIRDAGEVRAYLASRGIDYERAEPGTPVAPDAPAEELLAAYKTKIDELKARGGYVTADVIDVFPHTPNLDAMLNKFNAEHWHDEDEVRFIVEGRGLFHIHPPDGPGVCDRSRGRATSSACRAARTTGSTCAPIGASARSACSRIRPAGRRTTRERRGQALPAGLLRPGVLPDGAARPARFDRSAWPIARFAPCCSTSRARRRRSRSCTRCCSRSRATTPARSSTISPPTRTCSARVFSCSTSTPPIWPAANRPPALAPRSDRRDDGVPRAG